MPSSDDVLFLKDFTGGLNLTVQQQNIQPNETPACINVDFGSRGGITLRAGWRRQVTDTDLDGAQIIAPFSGGTTTENLYMIDNDGKLCYTTGAVDNFTTSATTVTDDITAKARMAVYGDVAYLANCRSAGSIVMKKLAHPATVTNLTNTANNNYASPSSGNAPLARLIANHMGYLWWADTVESGTRYRYRVRFSHFLQPENFADADYFDIDKNSDDEITALVPFGAALLVFKRRSVHAIYGSGRDDFVPERITGVSGAPNQEAVSFNAGVCYWWSTDGNVFAYNGRGVVPLGERIRGAVFLNLVDTSNSDARVNWAAGKLYVSLVASSGTARLLYVYDPSVGENGAWTQYDWGYTYAWWWRQSGGDALLFFIKPSVGKLFSFGDPTVLIDLDTSDTPINGRYFTGWQDVGETATRKRWMRPRITAGASTEMTMFIDTYHDFNLSSTTMPRQFLPLDSGVGGGLWGDDWGDFVWSGAATTIVEFERIQRLGKSHVVALDFTVDSPTGQWWIDSIAIPFKRKAIR